MLLRPAQQERLTDSELEEFKKLDQWLERYRIAWNKSKHPPSKPFSPAWHICVVRWRWLRDKAIGKKYLGF